MFIPKTKENENIDSYLDFIYSSLIQDDILENAENDDSSSTSNDNKQITKQNKIENIKQIECLELTNTENLIQRVCAATYLFLNKLWEIPNKASLIATILDSQMKNFLFANGSDCTQQRMQAKFLLRNLYTQLKQNSADCENIEECISTEINNNIEDIFTKMWATDQIIEEDEVTHYLCYPTHKYLSIPATSVPSECFFSDARNHILARR
ncbi:20520_t:CDS:2, partial [Cetraspora pellucida]